MDNDLTPPGARWPENNPQLCALGEPHQPDPVTGLCRACEQPA
jgi:hypothetical protein